jgi:hypothetical protein
LPRPISHTHCSVVANSLTTRPENTVRPIPLVLSSSIAISAIAAAQPSQALKELDVKGRAIATNPCRSPTSTQVTKKPNLHYPAVTDEILTIQCNSITVEIYKANFYTPPVRLPVSVRLTKPHPSPPKSLQVGTNLASVIQALGPPASSSNSTACYPLSLERPDEDTIWFVHNAGRVSAVSCG